MVPLLPKHAPFWSITPHLLPSLGLALSPLPSNTQAPHWSSISPQLRAALQLTGNWRVFEVLALQ